jgi:hypothetical protein
LEIKTNKGVISQIRSKGKIILELIKEFIILKYLNGEKDRLLPEFDANNTWFNTAKLNSPKGLVALLRKQFSNENIRTKVIQILTYRIIKNIFHTRY